MQSTQHSILPIKGPLASEGLWSLLVALCRYQPSDAPPEQRGGLAPCVTVEAVAEPACAWVDVGQVLAAEPYLVSDKDP